MDLEVDSDGLREATRMLDDASPALRLPGCFSPRVGDDALGPSAAGREAADLFTRRAEQSVEAMNLLATGTEALAAALTMAAAGFDRLESTLGPR
jgi:hypothetical protein